jgi:hypothetical protein
MKPAVFPLTGAIMVLAAALVACAPGGDTAVTPPGTTPTTDGSSGLPPGPTVPGARWDDPATWPDGKVPTAGADVTILAGSRVVLNTTPPSLGDLMVHGELVFDNRDLRLNATSVQVMGKDALFQIGSELAPYAHDALITLSKKAGADDTKESTKGITVMDGARLELHGESRARVSWTQLASTAAPGATSLTLKESVDWKPGDLLVVAPSGFDPMETERVQVRSVSGNTVAFSPALKFSHFGETQSYAHNGRTVTVDERAEVGLLSRNIVVQGDANSEAEYAAFNKTVINDPTEGNGDDPTPADPDTSDTPDDPNGYDYVAPVDSYKPGFGGHIMVMAGGAARVEGVELRRMGRTGFKGRYPLHFHLAGDVNGSYVKHSSVYDSFQRAVVAHQTSNLLVEGNVAYNVINHMYILAEDGRVAKGKPTPTETGNRFVDNLGVLVYSPPVKDQAFHPRTPLSRSTQDEERSAVFWMNHPNVTLRGNHAVGTVKGNGFFYGRNGFTTSLNVQFDFKDNVAHTIGGAEDRLAGKPHENNPNYPPNAVGFGVLVGREIRSSVPMLVEGLTAYKSTNAGIWTEGPVNVVRGAFADNPTGVRVSAGIKANAVVKDTVIVGQTKNTNNWLRLQDRSQPSAMPVPGNTTGYTGIENATQTLLCVDVDTVTFHDVGSAALSFTPSEYGREGYFRGSARGVKIYGNTAAFAGLLKPHDTFYGPNGAINIVRGDFTDLDGSLLGAGAGAKLYGPSTTAPKPEWAWLDSANAYVSTASGGTPNVGAPLKTYLAFDGFDVKYGDMMARGYGSWRDNRAWATRWTGNSAFGYRPGGYAESVDPASRLAVNKDSRYALNMNNRLLMENGDLHAVSRSVQLPTGEAKLRFEFVYRTEGFRADGDGFTVLFTVDGATAPAASYVSKDADLDTPGWQVRTVDLKALAGKKVRVDFQMTGYTRASKGRMLLDQVGVRRD